MEGHIKVCPADKIREGLQIHFGIEKGVTYNTSDATLFCLRDDFIFVEAKSNIYPFYQKIAIRSDYTIELELALDKLDSVQHHSLLQLKYYATELVLSEDGKKNWNVYLIYEHFTETLPHFIQTLKQNKQRYLEIDLRTFIKNSISLFGFLTHISYNHKPIRPENFVLLNDGRIKFDGYNIPRFNCIHREASYPSKIYKSPESNGGESDQGKDKIFQLGLIFLTFASLKIFDTEIKHPEDLLAVFIEIGKKYSSELVTLLKKMLEFDVSQRPDFKELYYYVKNQEREMIQKKPQEEIKAFNLNEKYHEHELDFPKFAIKAKTNQPKTIASLDVKLQSETLLHSDNLALKYQKPFPQLKILHKFNSGTKDLLLLPVPTLNYLFMEIIRLKIEFKIPFYHQSLYTANQNFFLVGGKISDSQNTNLYRFSLGQDFLVPLASMHERIRLNPGLVALGDYLYVFGGGLNSEQIAAFDSCEMYNPETDHWRKIASMKHKVINALFFNYCNQYIYRIGGIDQNGALLNHADKYDIAQNKWYSLQYLKGNPTLSYSLNPQAVQINKEEIFVFGGINIEGKFSHESYLLNCKDCEKNNEKPMKVNIFSPYIFPFENTEPGECFVFGNDIIYLSSSYGTVQICSFDGKIWKELKKFTCQSCGPQRVFFYFHFSQYPQPDIYITAKL